MASLIFQIHLKEDIRSFSERTFQKIVLMLFSQCYPNPTDVGWEGGMNTSVIKSQLARIKDPLLPVSPRLILMATCVSVMPPQAVIFQGSLAEETV